MQAIERILEMRRFPGLETEKVADFLGHDGCSELLAAQVAADHQRKPLARRRVVTDCLAADSFPARSRTGRVPGSPTYRRVDMFRRSAGIDLIGLIEIERDHFSRGTGRRITGRT